MSLADYLAKNYLTADPAPEKKSKKRKRKGAVEPATTGLIIADDDDSGWNNPNTGDLDEDGPLTVTSQSAEFRRSKKSSWKVVGAPTPSSTDQAAADAIIASAAAETTLLNHGTEDDPAVVPTSPVTTMESGAHAGLQSADQVTAALKKRQAEERARFLEDDAAHSGRGSETIYRDASGRIINVAMKRAEARKAAEAEEAKQAAEREAAKGAVQQAAKTQRRKDLQDAKYMPVSRYADDAELNDELKAQDRWNDPAAGFLEAKKAGKSVTGRPLYRGPAEPNRYGIRPGHKWDGVDRGNGFEKEYFRARNRRKNVRELEYAWQMDE
ncbi:MAG: Pre-mRNA-splicing factor cwc26 [Caeruleum heppii]|nr:MAG: Pre-mRNA-splicing factor cwc26 [Caeruleum heppii]